MRFLGQILLVATAIAQPQQGGEVRLEISTNGEPARVGEAIRITLTLRNLTRTRLWVNARMALNHENAGAYAREVSLRVSGPRGEPVGFDCKVRPRAISPGDYKVIGPKESIQSVESLDCFSFRVPGTYTIIATYQDGNPEPPPAPPKTIHWTGEVRSAPVQITIVPTPSSPW